MKTTTYDDISPDYGKAQSLAYETVQNSGQSKLPLSVKKLIRSFPNISLQKYTVFAKRRNLSLEEVYQITNSEEGCLWMNGKNKFIILYNDMIENTGRIRFTLAHELGHYVLKHNELSEKTKLSRYSLTSDEYDIFEKEANYFAKRLLAPIPLVDLYMENWNEIVATSIEYAFNTSYTVAHHIITDLKRRYKRSMIVREGHPMVDSFIDFINADANSKICMNCFGAQDKDNDFCIFCGNTHFNGANAESYANYFVERDNIMDYSKIETNEQGTPVKCPSCEYEGLNDDFNYCPICSTYIHNVCLGPDSNKTVDTFFGTVQLTLQERSEDSSSCDGVLSGNFRYCPKCGATTSYKVQGLLKNWDLEKELKEDPPF
ncbi:hypothetical protein IGI37_002293 [Enterococcus sp. AZ194]|uniref:ImmA/IrrE family metallo-endopeptidase n=1 Tax=Enterococcus sp. AZ194 TaxID=2774629 RepID=UPI003F214E04